MDYSSLGELTVGFRHPKQQFLLLPIMSKRIAVGRDARKKLACCRLGKSYIDWFQIMYPPETSVCSSANQPHGAIGKMKLKQTLHLLVLMLHSKKSCNSWIYLPTNPLHVAMGEKPFCHILCMYLLYYTKLYIVSYWSVLPQITTHIAQKMSCRLQLLHI